MLGFQPSPKTLIVSSVHFVLRTATRFLERRPAVEEKISLSTNWPKTNLLNKCIIQGFFFAPPKEKSTGVSTSGEPNSARILSSTSKTEFSGFQSNEDNSSENSHETCKIKIGDETIDLLEMLEKNFLKYNPGLKL